MEELVQENVKSKKRKSFVIKRIEDTLTKSFIVCNIGGIL